MKFSFTKTLDFPPEVSMRSFKNNIEVVRETKLLGVVITDDLKWAANTQYICSRAYKKLWVLRRLRVLVDDKLFLVDVYQKEVRSILEFGVPAWHSGLTKSQSSQIERVQRVAVAIILGKTTVSYAVALKYLGLEFLHVRCENFVSNLPREH